uniref:Uncharacterized protein n=1 Tax=Arundo donax TaxID=35708 RepID=A0A0A9ALV7_ARUDO
MATPLSTTTSLPQLEVAPAFLAR